MLFTSYAFLAFLAIVFLLYYILPGKWQWKWLLMASWLFYALADPRYLFFILTTSVTVWAGALRMDTMRKENDAAYAAAKDTLDRAGKSALKEAHRKRLFRVLLLCLLVNIGILAVTKYTNFMIANLNGVLAAFGRGAQFQMLSIIVPMGISFYTFQATGYLIDVYRGKYPAQTNFFRFALFVSFFPQLVQGPISRYNDLSETLYGPHPFAWEHFSRGLQRILWGFFKKLVIADRILTAVNEIIKNPETYRGVFVLTGMLFYALELYADFTGGIDITIGTAEALGIRVKENFIRPYFSKNIKEYWKRWHISMGEWFTDYIFYPVSVAKPLQKLGKSARKRFGNAFGKRVPVYLSSAIVWFTTGIWHGASWNFIAWGMGNFVVIMISQELEPLYERFHARFAVDGKVWYKCFQVIRTVLLMSCLRMFDCYRDVPLTFRMFFSMLSESFRFGVSAELVQGLGLSGFDYGVLTVSLLLLIIVSLKQRRESVRTQIAALPAFVRYPLWYALFVAVILFGAYGVGYDASQFIYNQF